MSLLNALIYNKGFVHSSHILLIPNTGLHLSHTEIDDLIRKSTNVLLTRTLSGSVSVLLKQPNLSLLQLIQIAVNMNYLEKSCDYLEEFISNTTGSVNSIPRYCKVPVVIKMIMADFVIIGMYIPEKS